MRPLPGSNIAAIEPYHHVPVNSITVSDPEKQSNIADGVYGGQKQTVHSHSSAVDAITHLEKEGMRRCESCVVLDRGGPLRCNSVYLGECSKK